MVVEIVLHRYLSKLYTSFAPYISTQLVNSIVLDITKRAVVIYSEMENAKNTSDSLVGPTKDMKKTSRDEVEFLVDWLILHMSTTSSRGHLFTTVLHTVVRYWQQSTCKEVLHRFSETFTHPRDVDMKFGSCYDFLYDKARSALDKNRICHAQIIIATVAVFRQCKLSDSCTVGIDDLLSTIQSKDSLKMAGKLFFKGFDDFNQLFGRKTLFSEWGNVMDVPMCALGAAFIYSRITLGRNILVTNSTEQKNAIRFKGKYINLTIIDKDSGKSCELYVSNLIKLKTLVTISGKVTNERFVVTDQLTKQPLLSNTAGETPLSFLEIVDKIPLK